MVEKERAGPFGPAPVHRLPEVLRNPGVRGGTPIHRFQGHRVFGCSICRGMMSAFQRVSPRRCFTKYSARSQNQ